MKGWFCPECNAFVPQRRHKVAVCEACPPAVDAETPLSIRETEHEAIDARYALDPSMTDAQRARVYEFALLRVWDASRKKADARERHQQARLRGMAPRTDEQHQRMFALAIADAAATDALEEARRGMDYVARTVANWRDGQVGDVGLGTGTAGTSR